MTRATLIGLRLAAPILAIALAAPASARAQAAADRGDGRPLADALRELQAAGLRIVFSTSLVTPELRVRTPPKSRAPRAQLDELLEPHGLAAVDGPAGIIQVLRAKDGSRPRRKRADEPADTDRRGAGRPETGAPALAHAEHLVVVGSRPYRHDRGLAAESSLVRRQWDGMHAGLAEQPFRAIQALPRVEALDDFRADFSVRGSPPRHVGVVIDGVPTRWLQHAGHARGPTASREMFSGEVLELATLRAGAYPRRHGDRLGAELELSIREGSRERTSWRGTAGGTNATVVGEGPLGGARRGSWLLAVRQSYLEWPSEKLAASRAVFGFADGLFKAAYDVSPRQQVTLSVLGGRSNVEGEDVLDPGEPGDGVNHAALVNAAWRSSLGGAAAVTQRVSLVRHGYRNLDHTGGAGTRGAGQEAVYRADVVSRVAGGVLEAGARVGRLSLLAEARGAEARDRDVWIRSAHAHASWTPRPSLIVSPGLRVTADTRLPRPALSYWTLGEWRFLPRWRLNASAGTSLQAPDAPAGPGIGAGAERPERAAHVDVGVEHQPADAVRWQATLFRRDERDIRPAASTPAAGPPLRGTYAGVELLLDVRASRLSGWLSYSYGQVRSAATDAGDVRTSPDRRHSTTLFGTWTVSERTRVGATFRAGSGLPSPPGAGLASDPYGGDPFGWTGRPYSRLDLRADHRVDIRGRPVVLFAEAVNVLGPPHPALRQFTGGVRVGF